MLENLKIKLVKLAKDAEKYNLCSEKAGSFSIRDKASGYVIITPSKIKADKLTAENTCVVDLDGNKIQGLDGIKPSSDLLMHLEIYKARKDIRSIMHINPSYITSFAVANKVIPPITYDSANYGGYIYVANCQEKTTEQTKDLIEKLKVSDVCLLERNGAVIVSQDIEDILGKAKHAEKVAEIYYRALMLNGFKEPKRFTRQELMSYLEEQ